MSLYLASVCWLATPANTLEFRTHISGSADGGGRTPPASSCFAVILLLWSFSLASLRSISTLPSRLTPANNPFVFEYANTPATPFKLAAPAASAFLPTGPASMDTFPPSVSEPCCENVRTAAALLRMKTKSVSSKPIWPPKPPPPVASAEGADQVPSANRATKIPEPKLAVRLTAPSWGGGNSEVVLHLALMSVLMGGEGGRLDALQSNFGSFADRRIRC